MMRHRLTAFCILLSFLLCSCATHTASRGETSWSSPHACIAAHTAGGALVGAAAGALIAAVTGGRAGRGAVIGTAAGASLGFAYAWGKCFSSFTKVKSVPTSSYKSARNRMDYKPVQGPVVRITRSDILPAAIAPGDQPEMQASYYVMAPNEQDMTVTETVALKVFNPKKKAFEEVGETSETIVVTPGERKATSEIPIPSNAEEGKFFIVFKVEMQGKRAEREMPLTITSDDTILAKAKMDAAHHIAMTSRPSAPDEASEEAQTIVLADAGSKNIKTGGSPHVMVTANKVNIRESPNVKSKIVAKASEGNRFQLVKSKVVNGKQWHHIKLEDGKLAWIIGSNCKLTE